MKVGIYANKTAHTVHISEDGEESLCRLALRHGNPVPVAYATCLLCLRLAEVPPPPSFFPKDGVIYVTPDPERGRARKVTHYVKGDPGGFDLLTICGQTVRRRDMPLATPSLRATCKRCLSSPLAPPALQDARVREAMVKARQREYHGTDEFIVE